MPYLAAQSNAELRQWLYHGEFAGLVALPDSCKGVVGDDEVNTPVDKRLRLRLRELRHGGRYALVPFCLDLRSLRGLRLLRMDVADPDGLGGLFDAAAAVGVDLPSLGGIKGELKIATQGGHTLFMNSRHLQLYLGFMGNLPSGLLGLNCAASSGVTAPNGMHAYGRHACLQRPNVKPAGWQARCSAAKLAEHRPLFMVLLPLPASSSVGKLI